MGHKNEGCMELTNGEARQDINDSSRRDCAVAKQIAFYSAQRSSNEGNKN
jgi:hypothetical protein